MGASAATESHERPPHTATGGPEAPTPDPRVGEVVANRFRLLARIHTSSTGAVYRAEDLALSRPVALRLLTPILSRDQAVLERLQQRLQASTRMALDEVRVLSDIVDIVDIGRSDSGQVFVVTDFITGESLADQLAREGPLPWPAVRPLMVRACQILHLSHERGVVRLDLQTRHLFPVRDKRQASTLKILSPGLQLDPALTPEMVRYAAPEQITRTAVDRRTDIYSLGIIMYELLTGHVPFADAVPAVILARHLLEPPPSLPMYLRDAVPAAVLAIVHRALAKHPDERWPTMRAMANALAAIDFGPCDVSGMLEVVDGEPIVPSTSSASMRIDPSASMSAPSPSVRPRTFPPLQTAFMAQEPDPRGPDDSASGMAWEEILAAAEEAIAAVASGRSSGTAGDSGVFLPESMLHTGQAASASQHRGRVVRPIEPSLAETLILPMSLVRPEAPTEPTMQLGPHDLLADSHVALILPPLTKAAAASMVAAVAPTSAGEPVDAADSAAALTRPTTPVAAAGVDTPAATSAADLPRPPSATESSTIAPSRTGMYPGESTATLHVAAGRAAGSPRGAWLPWAAGLLLFVTAGAIAVRTLGSAAPVASERAVVARSDLSPGPATDLAAPAGAGATDLSREAGTTAGPRGSTPATDATAASAAAPDAAANQAAGAPPTLPDTRADLAPGTAATTAGPAPAPAADLSPGTATTAAVPAPGPASNLAPGTAVTTTAATPPRPTEVPRPRAAAPPAAPARKPLPSAAREPDELAPETAAAAPPPAAPPAADDLAPGTADPPAPAPAPTPSDPATPPAVTPPPAATADLPSGTGAPPTAPADPVRPRLDPTAAAALLARAEQSAARGEHMQALGLAVQSFNAAPTARSLQVAGVAACKLGNADKAKWAHQHLAAHDRGPMVAACKAADVALP